jgi:hypothetical protein
MTAENFHSLPFCSDRVCQKEVEKGIINAVEHWLIFGDTLFRFAVLTGAEGTKNASCSAGTFMSFIS